MVEFVENQMKEDGVKFLYSMRIVKMMMIKQSS